MALMDVVEWKNKKGEILYRFPEGSISLGAQLIVMEHQEAVFFREGQALDSFGPGRHTLKTGNIPILEKLINIPFGGKSPFPAEVYFLNKTEIPNMKWGTKVPLDLQDPVYHIAVPIRAFGNFSIKIIDTKSFLMMAIGTWQAFTSEAVESTLRDQIILQKLQDLIAEFMEKQGITILKLPGYYDEIAVSGRAKIMDDFASFGLELVRFAIESINVPQDDESVKRLKKALADKAEIGIMGQDDYKMRRTFDTMEKAAGSEGMAGGAMGAGMGFGMGNQMSQMMGKTMGGVTGTEQVVCPSCTTMNPSGAKFCSSCGKEMIMAMACPKCGAKISTNAKFCPECGTGLEGSACVKCGIKLKAAAKFCPDCGAAQS
ncbi:MAG: SPFH domain-containing protein [Chrysiogenales bacterium]|nr:MAG: SPFH domain-containing protein [Chrysiogenales bacterium]